MPRRASSVPAGIRAAVRPAYYAARSGGWRDWWTLLHPPYTAWHLAYVVIGAALAPRVGLTALIATLIAFFLAVGLAAHALDELNGRPLRTQISAPVLIAVTVTGLAGAVALGVAGIARIGWALLPFMIIGPSSRNGLQRRAVRRDPSHRPGLRRGVGRLPRADRVRGADREARASRRCWPRARRWPCRPRSARWSTPARSLRRRSVRVEGGMTLADGRVVPVTADGLLAPWAGACGARHGPLSCSPPPWPWPG